jgi:hypothetical protein
MPHDMTKTELAFSRRDALRMAGRYRSQRDSARLLLAMAKPFTATTPLEALRLCARLIMAKMRKQTRT